MGKAKSNKCVEFTNCTLPGEADTGYYAGDNDYHSSGVIQYLQVEYGGDRISTDKELNGITLNAVGLGTDISNVAVLYNSDDCIEFFGGAVTARNIFCYKGEDDGIDTTDGARIFLQNGVVVAGAYPNAGADNDLGPLYAWYIITDEHKTFISVIRYVNIEFRNKTLVDIEINHCFIENGVEYGPVSWGTY